MVRVWLIIFLAFGAAGCSGKKLDKLLTLKSLADEQEAMGQDIEEQDRKFTLMVEEMKAGTLDDYLTQKRIARQFGDPIFAENISRDQQPLEVWMYRYAAQFFGSEKIYLYFDPDGNLVESKYVEAADGKGR